MTANSLISSDKVDGTSVYGADRSKIGSIHHLEVEKVSGRVAYAVMSFGGFLGIGEDYYPVPWSELSYDIELDGYITNLTEERLENAPRYDEHSVGNRDWDRRTHDHYNAAYYWPAD